MKSVSRLFLLFQLTIQTKKTIYFKLKRIWHANNIRQTQIDRARKDRCNNLFFSFFCRQGLCRAGCSGRDDAHGELCPLHRCLPRLRQRLPLRSLLPRGGGQCPHAPLLLVSGDEACCCGLVQDVTVNCFPSPLFLFFFSILVIPSICNLFSFISIFYLPSV